MTTSPNHPENEMIKVLLVDDQEIVAAGVRNMLEDEPGIEFHFCSDPSTVIDVANKIQPTVILQDLVMPDIDGLTLVRFFRANDATKEVPIVVLSSKEEAATKAESFACGANDYLVKFPDKLEVIARLRYHSKGYTALLQRNKAYRALAKELAEAAEYVISLLPAPLDQEPSTKWCFEPSTQLGGDSFGYHWMDDEHFAVYLLDVCGHGVGAALLSVSVMNVLRSQSLPGVDFKQPAEVLVGLNNTFKMENHNGMFFTIWYGVYHTKEKQLSYSSGGHPPAILISGPDSDNSNIKLLTGKGVVIGAMPDMDFKTETCSIDKYSKLYVYSDGAYEITVKSTGKMWTLEDFTDMVEAYAKDTSGKDIRDVRDQISRIQGKEQFEDDFSLLEVTF
ncbi:MAG: SpoIIE family protein phosphatase [Phycisphaeraceae bacterium]|nr:SpoIIE family protein phosphatase [Phycisphaeraceae bacterium]